MNSKERIDLIRENLEENDRLYRDGKRTKAVWMRCKHDAKERIAELKKEK
jgi:hypothetical protein